MSLFKGYSFHIIVIAVFPLLLVSCQRHPEFQFDFENEGDLNLLVWKCGTQLSLSEDHATSGTKSLKMVLYPEPAGSGNIYPGLYFSRFAEDWSGREKLCFDVYNPYESSLQLVLRIDDTQKPAYGERYNHKVAIHSGLNRIVIPLKDMVTSETKRPLDLTAINKVILFMNEPQKVHTFYIDHLRIE